MLKVQNIADVGPSEFIDGLIIIPHHTKVAVLGSQQPYQLKLGRIGILILIYHDIAETLLIVVQNFGIIFKKLHGLYDQIIKIQSIAAF